MAYIPSTEYIPLENPNQPVTASVFRQNPRNGWAHLEFCQADRVPTDRDLHPRDLRPDELRAIYQLYPHTRRLIFTETGILIVLCQHILLPRCPVLSLASIPLAVTNNVATNIGPRDHLGHRGTGLPLTQAHLTGDGLDLSLDQARSIMAECRRQYIPLRGVFSVYGQNLAGIVSEVRDGVLPSEVSGRPAFWRCSAARYWSGLNLNGTPLTPRPEWFPTVPPELQPRLRRNFAVEYHSGISRVAGYVWAVGWDLVADPAPDRYDDTDDDEAPPALPPGTYSWRQRYWASASPWPMTSAFLRPSRGNTVLDRDTGHVLGRVLHHNVRTQISTIETPLCYPASPEESESARNDAN